MDNANRVKGLRGWLSILLIFNAFVVIAQKNPAAISITNQTKQVNISNQIYYLEDEEGNLGIEDILKQEYSKKFVLSEKNILNFQSSDSWYWLRINIENQSDAEEWILELSEAKLEIADLFFLNQKNEWEKINNGYRIPNQEKFKKHYFQIFPLNFYKKNAVFYIRTKTNAQAIPVKIFSKEEFEQHHSYKNIFVGIFLGIMLLIIFNNLIYGILTKKIIYFLYIITVFGYAISTVLSNGYFKLLFDVDLLKFSSIAILLNGASVILYCKSFLNIRSRSMLGILLNISMLLLIINTAIAFFLSPMESFILMRITNPLITIVIIAAFFSLKREKQFAFYYLSAYLILLFFVFLEILHSNTHSPEYFYLTHIEWGFLTEVVVLSYVLNLRFDVEKRKLEKEKWQVQFEKEWISKDLHDNIGSQLAVLIKKLEQLGERISDKQASNLTDMANNIVNELRSTVWAIQKESIELDDLVDKVRDLIWNIGTLPNTLIDCRFEKHEVGMFAIHADKALNIFRIIQEALHNSIKHSKAKHIQVGFQVPNSNELSISIEDDGVGFDIESKNSRENYGLLNMKARALLIGAQYSVVSEKGKGTNINICIQHNILGKHK